MTRKLYASLICKSVNPSSKGVPAVRYGAPVGAVLVVPLRALDGPRRASMPDANLTMDRHGRNLPRRGKMNRFGRRIAYSGTKMSYETKFHVHFAAPWYLGCEWILRDAVVDVAAVFTLRGAREELLFNLGPVVERRRD